MSSLEDPLQKAVVSIPECVAAGYVDLTTGMLLGIRTVDSHPQEVLELLSAATSDLFQGTNVVMIENLFKKARGLPPDGGYHYFQEMVITSDNLLHIFLRGRAHTDHVVVFVCRRSANLGMVIMKARAALPDVEAAV